ncbi:hypothetical protein [uncultured Actinomyces sp.]|jgi:hypothetical protein|uniref:hypothetical protein n=1 Tax=uncultured Actinomyces sp. TaxID=249061 RepID=UPI0026230B1D|nr:hypothetical protein [uncultured Actinomyces sp.]
MVEKAEKAQERAANNYNGLAKRYDGKTVSADGAISLSGWGRRKRGFQEPNIDKVLEMQEKIGHPRNSHNLDNGVLGRFYACHAERQLSITAKIPAIGVSKNVCNDCQEYFSRLAQYQGRDWYVADPSWTWIFHSDGAVTKLPRS